MVKFGHAYNSKRVETLTITDDDNQRDTILDVGTPLAGIHTNRWPTLINTIKPKDWTEEFPKSSNRSLPSFVLRSPLHRIPNNDLPFDTLGRRVAKGDAMWDDAFLHFSGEFHYCPGYWEWTEDVLVRCKPTLTSTNTYEPIYASLFTYECNLEIIKALCEAWSPSTNTLVTSLGELSVSLWDLKHLAGLPIFGSLYDEVIPSDRELFGKEKENLHLPRSCIALFHAFHLIRAHVGDDDPRVPVKEWVNFWSKKEVKYKCPPSRKERKSVRRPQATHNPSGKLEPYSRWSSQEEIMFSQLGIKGCWKEETFLAAHLACWLCIFVLPIKDVGFIRPSTFKMASLIASGQRVCLAIPVLASIYKGLNSISKSTQPSQGYLPFPIHFVYGWVALYFKTQFSIHQESQKPTMTIFSGENGARPFV